MTKEERMFSLVKAQKSSGLGARAYSKSLGNKYATFQYWCKRYRDWQQAGLPGGHDKVGKFVSLRDLLAQWCAH
jgi:hypothetical protein